MTTKTDPGKKLLADIALGRLDDYIFDVFMSAHKRSTELQVQSRWKITLGEDTFNEDDFTIRAMELVEASLGINWIEVSPANSARHMLAVIRAYYLACKGYSTEEANAVVEGLTMGQVGDFFDVYQVPSKGDAPA